jgi:hypothetical protein
MAEDKIKAKRVLKNFDFTSEGASVALVGPVVGGAANNKKTVLYKSKGKTMTKRSEAFIQKMQEVTVTLPLPKFLEKFFYIWGDDCDALAALMGYVEPPDSTEPNDPESDPVGWLSEKIGGLVTMKSLKASEDITKAVATLSEEDYLQVLQDQAMLEPIIKQVEALKKGKKPVNKKKETKMEDDTVTIEKAQHAEIVKQLAEQAELIKAFQAEKIELTKAAKLQVVKSALKDEKQAEAVFKSLSYEDEAAFVAAVEVLKSLQAQIDSGAQFQELGASAQDPEVKPAESLVAKALKAKFSK